MQTLKYLRLAFYPASNKDIDLLTSIYRVQT